MRKGKSLTDTCPNMCVLKRHTDVVSSSTEQFISNNGMIKNAINLIDHDRSEEIDELIGGPQ